MEGINVKDPMDPQPCHRVYGQTQCTRSGRVEALKVEEGATVVVEMHVVCSTKKIDVEPWK